jgi:hypothetical protein
MKAKSLNRYFFFKGLSFMILSVLMLIFIAKTFSATGDFPRFMITLGEFCFVFWFPSLILGIIFFITGIIATVYKANKK